MCGWFPQSYGLVLDSPERGRDLNPVILWGPSDLRHSVTLWCVIMCICTHKHACTIRHTPGVHISAPATCLAALTHASDMTEHHCLGLAWFSLQDKHNTEVVLPLPSSLFQRTKGVKRKIWRDLPKSVQPHLRFSLDIKLHPVSSPVISYHSYICRFG